MNKHGIRLITAVVTSSMIVTPVLAAPSVDDLKKEKASKQNEVSSLQPVYYHVSKEFQELLPISHLFLFQPMV